MGEAAFRGLSSAPAEKRIRDSSFRPPQLSAQGIESPSPLISAATAALHSCSETDCNEASDRITASGDLQARRPRPLV